MKSDCGGMFFSDMKEFEGILEFNSAVSGNCKIANLHSLKQSLEYMQKK